MVWIFIVFMVQELDRANLIQALSDNFLDDIHCTTNDYNTATTIGRVTFFLMEMPSQLLSKRFGPDRWLPAQMILWAIVATSQFFVYNRTTFFICRFLIGVFTAGFIPEVILYLSQWYKHHELSIRLGFFYTAMSFADMFASLIAYGILHMRGLDGKAGWQWLFLIEVRCLETVNKVRGRVGLTLLVFNLRSKLTFFAGFAGISDHLCALFQNAAWSLPNSWISTGQEWMVQ